MRLIICEKPSVAKTVAAALGAAEQKNGYIQGDDLLVSWCVGHLVSMADAGSYDERFKKWQYEDLPILPEEWKYTLTPGKEKQFSVLQELMHRIDVTELVNGCDAGREGELIFRFVVEQAGCDKPVKRLWISSMEDSAIREGYAAMQDGKEYDALYQSALCRARADWLVGINATRLFSVLYHKTLNVGRVLSPTLNLLVERDGKIMTFKKEKYHVVHIGCSGADAKSEHIPDAAEADKLKADCEQSQAVCTSLTKEKKTVQPPKLFDLTSLQREANRVYGFTAKQTLDYAQALYEKRLLTYPRTDSSFITADMEAATADLVSALLPMLPFMEGAALSPNIGRVIDNAKVTDHHAILPTAEFIKTGFEGLAESEKKLLSLVCMKLLCAVAPPHEYEAVTVIFECCGKPFTAKGKVILSEGWKDMERRFRLTLKSKDAEQAEDEAALPELAEGQTFDKPAASVSEHYTTPPKPYTEDTLLSSMESAGKEEMPLVRADALFKALDEEKRVEREKPGYEGSWYDKTKFRIDFTFQGKRDTYEGRQDFGDGDGSLIDHIRGYHEYYANNESHKNYVLRNGGAEAWEQEKAQTDMLLHEFVPYLELHRNLSEQERTAADMLEAETPLTPEQTAYLNAVLSHVDACREKLNSGDYDLPAPPQLADFDKELQDYKAHVEEEIAQEAAAAGMTVEEYAANGYEPVTQEKAAVRYYPIHEEAARRANDANSFRDYKPGSATAEYRRMVDHAAELAQEQKGRVDPMYHDKIDALLDTYARRLAENMNKHYAIEGRVPSVMIAGSSNFPVRKKEKQNAARDRNMQEWQDVQGLLDKIRSTGMGGISADDPQAVQKLEAKLASLVEAQENMKAINAYYRKHGTLDGCTVLPEKQIKALQQDMKSSWHLEPKPFQSFELSNNNAEIRRTRARIEELKRHGEKEYSGWTFDGGRVEANKEANRLQIFFDGKPDEATREELKANGFRWAPSAGAWQRQLNDNAYRAAGYIPSIQPIAVEPPVPDASLTGERVTTPRGSFHVTALSREQMEDAGYGVHHQSEDRKYLIMGNGTRAFAVAAAPPENYLKNAEMSTEQNYNMIDGQINNTPTVYELEEKAKRGEVISLTALAAAVKAEDSRKPQREPEGKKPSIRAQLKADKARAAARPKQQEQAAKRSIRQSLEME